MLSLNMNELQCHAGTFWCSATSTAGVAEEMEEAPSRPPGPHVRFFRLLRGTQNLTNNPRLEGST